MRYFGIRMFNFLRFGETHNSIVFDVTEDQKTKINSGELSLDTLYDELKASPSSYVDQAKTREADNVIAGIVGIAGMTAGSFDSSNGAGKSTVFEAMAYANYDRIVRQTANTDKKASAGLSVVTKLDGQYPDNLKESYVEEFFEEDGKLYRLRRGRAFTKSKKSSTPIFEFDCYSDNDVDKLSGHRKKDTQESVDEVIVEDYDIFVNSVMFGQNDAGKFLMGTDKVKKEMIITLLKLENVVQGCMDIIREEKKEQNTKVTSVTSKIENLQDLVIKEYRAHELHLRTPTNMDDVNDVEYRDSIIDDVANAVSEEIDTNTAELAQITDRETELNKEITELEQTETIKKIKELKEEGNKLVTSRAEKMEKKNSELADWNKFCDDGEVKLQESNRQNVAQLQKVDDAKTKKKEYEEVIRDFDEDKIKEKLEKCDKASEVKEKYETMQVEALSKRDELVANIAEFKAVIHTKKAEVAKLDSQITSIEDGGKFVCSECKSVVSKEHVLKKIENGISNIEQNREKLVTLEGHLKKVTEAKVSVDARLQKIVGYALEKEKLNVTLEKNKNAKDNLSHYDQIIKDGEGRIKEIGETIKGIGEKAEEYKAKCKSIQDVFVKDVDAMDVEIAELRKQVAALVNDASETVVKTDHLKKIRENLIKERELLNKSIGSLNKEIESIIDLGKRIAEEKKNLKEEAIIQHRYIVLEKAFGLDGVQTRIVQKYLPLLNMYIKEYLDILSDGKMSIKMSINDKLKVDMIISGGTADTYSMLSGGEKMIVRLAVDVGLALLSFSRTAKTPDMICLDEIFGPLDNNHTKAVFKMLKELKNRFGRVFLISHKAEIQSLVQNNIIIEKSFGNRGLSKITGIGEISV